MSNCAIAFGAYLVGLSAHVVAVKATVTTDGQFTIELPKSDKGKPPQGWDGWIRETKIRVRSSLSQFGIDPCNFAISFDRLPARSSALDLAIFAACLGALGELPRDCFQTTQFGTSNDFHERTAKIFVGELSLRGQVRPVRGVLPILRGIARSRREDETDERTFVVPYDNAIEASHVDTGTNTYAVGHVSELFDLPAHTVARREYKPIEVNHFAGSPSVLPERVVRAIELAAIGKHRIAFIGNRAFKAARLLRDLLPPMTRSDAIETASMHSIAGLLRNEEGQIGMRSFRAPHHAVSEVGLVGGGDPIRPGELSLAHNGVLYLDSLPEFKRSAIERLADVLRAGSITINRGGNRAMFPARALLVTGCPQRCPCDAIGGVHSAFCTVERRKEWQSRHVDTLGIDMVIDVDFIDDELVCDESIEGIRESVADAREFSLRENLEFADESQRGKVARTIANLAGSVDIRSEHWEEAGRLCAT